MVLPGFLHIALVKALVQDKVLVAAQNVSKFPPGAYTGEVAADHLADYGIKWVLIGHSERRGIYKETDQDVAEKVKLAREKGLGVVLCIGEGVDDRKADKTSHVLSSQLEAVKGSFGDNWENVVIAYEPVWSLGTGMLASQD